MEERSCRRTPVEVGCWLVELDGASCVYTFDISENGVSIITKDPRPVGQVVKLQFYTPRSARAVTLEARVVWSRLEPEGGMGLAFNDLDAEKRGVLRSFMAELKRRKL